MYKKRRNQILKQLDNQSIAVFYSGKAPKKCNDQFYPFEVNKNFYYLTGIDQEDCYLLLIKGDNKQNSFLFIEPFDEFKAKWVGAGLTFEAAAKISNVDKVISLTNFYTNISSYLSSTRSAAYGQIKQLYFDLERHHIDDDKMPSEKLAKRIVTHYPNLDILNIAPVVNEMRTIKDNEEISNIKEAIKITEEGINALYKAAKPNMYEYQLEAYYNFVLNSHGVKPSFKTIAASGKNATILHYEKNNSKIKDGDLILFDLGVNYNNYCSDITRTFPVNGKFSERQRQIYEIVLNCNKKVIEFLKPGVTNKEFNDYAKKLLADGLIKIGLIETEAELHKYYYHSIGHHLGLDVHDVGDYTVAFKENQVVTVEPGLYIEQENIGIRIEDNILITKDGAINLSKNIIKEIDEIEKFMKK